jgi:ParB-like chromosome segregation protein Spo0J
MARKRKLDATEVPLEEDLGEADKPGMGGMWGGTAMNMLRQRLEDTRASISDGILNGTIAMELLPGQIDDPAGSDRQGAWEDDPEFQALVENIARRGQTQAIRVRPVDPNWQPSRDHPMDSADRFIIQSGRRRLAACRALNRKVVAVIATVEGVAALADLEERFHENTMRKNLSGFEELLSVGLIADALGDLSQQEIAQRLSVSQNDVSLGRACVELHDRIVAQVDIANTPKRAYREIIPRLRGGDVPPLPKATPQISRAVQGDVKVAVKTGAGGAMSLTLKGAAVDPDWLAKSVAELVAKKMKIQRT